LSCGRSGSVIDLAIQATQAEQARLANGENPNLAAIYGVADAVGVTQMINNVKTVADTSRSAEERGEAAGETIGGVI
jgi:hypothetical protein